MKKKKRKYNAKRAANNVLIGTVIKWKVLDPLAEKSEPLASNISHKNPMTSLHIEGIKRLLPQVVESMSVTYKISIDVEFNQDGLKYFRPVELEYTGRINDAKDSYYSEIERIFSEANMSQYVMTHVAAEIVRKSNSKKAA